MAGDAKRYRAFISYSQRDKRWAVKLHKALEAWRAPAGVSAPGLDAKTRKLGRFFRDDEEMGAVESLGAALQGAIDDSESLIVLCSPHSAKSKWVDLEVRRFKRRGGARVFAVIVGGTPHSNDPKTECFCPALKEKVGPDGELTGEPDEPLAPDWRKDGLERLKVRLAAGLLAAPFDDLWKREQRRARARRLQALAAGLGAVMLASAATVVGLRQQALERSRTLASLSGLVRERDGHALRLAVIAARRSALSPVAAEAEPRLAVAAENAKIHLMFHVEGTIELIEYSPSEDNFMTVVSRWPDKNGYAQIYDSRSGNAISTPYLHDGNVNFASYSPAGDRVITAGDDGVIKLWDTASGKSFNAIMRHDFEYINHGVKRNDRPQKAFFSADGSRILTVGFAYAQVWDARTSHAIGRPLTHEGGIASAAISPDGTLVITAGRDGTAQMWDATTSELISTTSNCIDRVSMNAVSFSPSGEQIIAVCNYESWGSGHAVIWDALTGERIAEPMVHEGRMVSAEFSPDGILVVTAGNGRGSIDGGELRVWWARTGLPLGETLRSDDIFSAKFSPDGERILSAGNDRANLWEKNNLGYGEFDYKKSLARPDGYHGGRVATFSSDGARVITGSEEGVVRAWDVPVEGSSATHFRHEQKAYKVNISPDGNYLTICQYGPFDVAKYGSKGDHSIITWNPDAAEPTGASIILEEGEICAAFSSDGMRVVTLDHLQANIWNIVAGRKLSKLDGHSRDIKRAAFSPDGTRIVTASLDKTARVWDAETGAPLTEPLRHEGVVWSAVFSPDGSRIVTASYDKTARVWDATTGAPLTEPLSHADLVTSAAFSPDGTRIVTASDDDTARVWDANTGAPLTEPLRHEYHVNSAAFSPDGTRILTFAFRDGARVWDAATGEPVTEPLGGGWVDSAAFSPDGYRVLTHGAASVEIWDAESGNKLLSTYAAGVRSAQLSDDGSQVVASGIGFFGPWTRIWDITWAMGPGDRARAGLPPLLDAVCDPREGKLRGELRLLTEGDLAEAPVLATAGWRAGDDVCAPPGVIERARRGLAGVFAARIGSSDDTASAE